MGLAEKIETILRASFFGTLIGSLIFPVISQVLPDYSNKNIIDTMLYGAELGLKAGFSFSLSYSIVYRRRERR